MIDLEMRLGKEIAEAVDKDNMVVFETTNQTYALFKIKDEAGAVAELAKGLYMVTAKDYKPIESKRAPLDCRGFLVV